MAKIGVDVDSGDIGPNNQCSPVRIYGPLSQTLFCGCSIIGVSAQVGWNEQSSSVTVDLVQDTCVGPRIWYDRFLTRFTGNMADPGFTYPEPGVAVYLRIEEYIDGTNTIAGTQYGGFEYSGLVDSWTERKDSNGNPVYSVRIVDPRAILQSVHVILGDYVGPTEADYPKAFDNLDPVPIYNVINVYGYLEYLGLLQNPSQPCPSSPALGIGGVTTDNIKGNIANDRGMNWGDVRCAIETLTGAEVYDNNHKAFCRYQRIVYNGPLSYGQGSQMDYGVMVHDLLLEGVSPPYNQANTYVVDLTEIPFAPLWYKLSGPSPTLLEIISQICEDAGCDYYIELVPVKRNNQVGKFIKIRVAKRDSQPQLGKLEEFITLKTNQASSSNGGVMSYVKGAEHRNEPTSQLLIGGNVQTPFGMTSIVPSNIIPYWGLDSDGYVTQAQVLNNQWYVYLDSYKIDPSLNNPFIGVTGRYIAVSENEIRAALADFNSWINMCYHMNGAIKSWLVYIGVGSLINFPSLANASVNNGTINTIPNALWRDDADIQGQITSDVENAYQFFKSFAEEFYGKQFLIDATWFLCGVQDISGTIAFNSRPVYRYSHLPATDGGWINDNIPNVIGLIHPTAGTDFFRDDVGKFQPILKFNLNSSLTLSASGYMPASPALLQEGQYLTDTIDNSYAPGTGQLWVKAQIGDQWIHGTPINPSLLQVSALLTISDPVIAQYGEDQNMTQSFIGLGMVRADNTITATPKFITPAPFVFQALPLAVKPEIAVVPVLSKVDNYGTWGVNGIPGQTVTKVDPSFVPWEFGSDTIMNYAGYEAVKYSASSVRKTERGSVTVAGFPNIPLGSELLSVDVVNPTYWMVRQRYIETRTFSISTCAALSFYYVDMLGRIDNNYWDGTFGPNITSINCSIGADGFTTTYDFSSYSPEYGRFSKNNADRLRQIGQTKLVLGRSIRSQIKRNVGIIAAAGRANAIGLTRFFKAVSSKAPVGAHSVMIGNYTTDGRVNAITNPIVDTPYTFSSETAYSEAAMMSMDGFFRPVSKNGDGSLPQYINPGSNCARAFSYQPDPPQYQKLDIDTSALDPLSNSTDSLISLHSSSSGHDVDVVAKGSTLTGNYYTIKEGGEAADYRFWAFKGPMVIQAWGYDLEGKPVPNEADNEGSAVGGTFTSSNLTDKFLQNWLQKPKTWPVAPLDIRLDRERGVWTIPSSFRNIHATSTGCLKSSKNVTIDNSKTGLTDQSGNPISNTGEVEWPWTINPPNNPGKFPVYYDSYDCKLYAFPINRLDIEKNGTTYSDIKIIKLGSGIGIQENGGTTCDKYVTIYSSGTSSSTGSCWCAYPSEWTGCLTGLSHYGTGWMSPFTTGTIIEGCYTNTGCVVIGDGLTANNVGGNLYLNSWNLIYKKGAAPTGEEIPAPPTGTPADPLSSCCNYGVSPTNYKALGIGSGLYLKRPDYATGADCLAFEIGSCLSATGNFIDVSDKVGDDYYVQTANTCMTGTPTSQNYWSKLRVLGGNLSLVTKAASTGNYEIPDLDDCEIGIMGFWPQWTNSNSGNCGKPYGSSSDATSYSNLKTIKFGPGLRGYYDEASCTTTIAGYNMISKITGACAASETSVNKTGYNEIVIGDGLKLTVNTSAGCEYAGQDYKTATIEANPLTASQNTSYGKGFLDSVGNITCPSDSGSDIDGPYCEDYRQKQMINVKGLVAGHGIGFASCGGTDCGNLIIYNNLKIDGTVQNSCESSCNTKTFAQVGQMSFAPAFKISSNTGTGCQNNFDGGSSPKITIDFSCKSVGSFKVVRSVQKVGNDIQICCGDFSYQQTCDDKFILTAAPTGNSSCGSCSVGDHTITLPAAEDPIPYILALAGW